jgi:hypothetical protein
VTAKITTPASQHTRVGPLRFNDGAPDPATVQRADDQLDISRGIEAFPRGMSASSLSSRPTPPRCL